MSGLNSRWYVVQTHSHAEQRALQHLGRQGFETYLPRYLKRRRHARKVETVISPLYPRYLFVAVDMAIQRWRAINSTVGVARLVCNGDAPASLEDAVVAGLRQREDALGYVQLAQAPVFVPGDRVRVTNGVFSDCLGLFEGMNSRQRVALLLDLLGRKVRVVLDGDLIATA